MSCMVPLRANGHFRCSPPPAPTHEPAPTPTPHLIVLLQQHGVGEALVQAQLCELATGAPDVHNQVRAGDVAQDVQEDLVGEAQQVGTACHRGSCRGHVTIIGQVLKIRRHTIPMGSPRAALGPASPARERSQEKPSPLPMGKNVLLPKTLTAEQELMPFFKSLF